jgi:hypothetical protein
MKIDFKISLVIIMIIGFCICIAYISGLTNTAETRVNNSGNPATEQITGPPSAKFTYLTRTTCLVTINATVTDLDRKTIPVYRGVLGENSSLDLDFESIGDIRWNVTSEEDAPEVARRLMESYGGIPPDAECNGASTHYSRRYNISRNEIVSENPMYTSISYSQKRVNGLWMIGDSNQLILALGDHGEPLWIHKTWRNYSYTGDVPIIPLDSAIEKLDRKELIKSDWHPEAGDITINNISLGYYVKKLPDKDTILEPLWMFYGSNASTGARLGFYVYARKFAGFTASPVTGEAPLEVSFSDRSETTPEKWHWDFGDGSNSDLRDPSHIYRQSGIYNVTLTVWNDLGSDTTTKQDLVTVSAANATFDKPVHTAIANRTQMAEGPR